MSLKSFFFSVERERESGEFKMSIVLRQYRNYEWAATQ